MLHWTVTGSFRDGSQAQVPCARVVIVAQQGSYSKPQDQDNPIYVAAEGPKGGDRANPSERDTYSSQLKPAWSWTGVLFCLSSSLEIIKACRHLTCRLGWGWRPSVAASCTGLLGADHICEYESSEVEDTSMLHASTRLISQAAMMLADGSGAGGRARLLHALAKQDRVGGPDLRGQPRPLEGAHRAHHAGEE